MEQAESWVMLWGEGGAWSEGSRSRRREQLVLHLSHSSCSPQCPCVHTRHIPALPVSQTGKLPVRCFQPSKCGEGKGRGFVSCLSTAILGPQEMTLKSNALPGAGSPVMLWKGA